MTVKIYDSEPYKSEARATVIKSLPLQEGFAVVCDKSNFFPGGGGQNCDTGSFGGEVCNKVYERDGEIYHVVPRAFDCGEEVTLFINAGKRFSDICIHTGEHILSGFALKLFGANNVGFHMGKDFSTVDFNREFQHDEIVRLEEAVNTAIRENHRVKIYYPANEVLNTLPLRKRPDKNEAIRVVEVEGCDMCACCGTHALFTGEVGILRIIGNEHFRGGARLSFLCGAKALAYCRADSEITDYLVKTFSADRSRLKDIITARNKELSSLHQNVTSLEKQLSVYIAHSLWQKTEPCENGERFIEAEPPISSGGLKFLADELIKLGCCSMFLRSEGNYLLTKSPDSKYDLQKLNLALREKGAKGGGRGDLFTGRLSK